MNFDFSCVFLVLCLNARATAKKLNITPPISVTKFCCCCYCYLVGFGGGFFSNLLLFQVLKNLFQNTKKKKTIVVDLGQL